ncbi:hypothetical protein ACFWDK_02965 [Micromonospora chalcea]
MIVAGVGGGQTSAGGGPREVTFAELGEEQRGELVGVGGHGMRVLAVVAVVRLGGSDAVVDEVGQPAGEEAVPRVLVGGPDLGDVVLDLAEGGRLDVSRAGQCRCEVAIVVERGSQGGDGLAP